jgi:hypothetical protein
MGCSAVESKFIGSSGVSINSPIAAHIGVRTGGRPSESIGVENVGSDRIRNAPLAPAKNETVVQLIPHFKQFLAFLISVVPEVRSVFMHEEGNFLRVIVRVDDFDFDVNERIYDNEELIMEIFSNLEFDFEITTLVNLGDPDLELVFSR